MKYISLVDELGLDLETLSNIDSSKIIRLQKQLKANAILNNTSNLGELSLLIEHFKNDSTRKKHLFIEKHLWLKKIVMGRFSDIPVNSIFIDRSFIDDEEALKYFLSPYLKENIKPFLSETLNKGKYELLFSVVKNHFLFSEEIIQIIINFFKSKLNYAIVYLNGGKLNDKEHPISFIKNRRFINCLSEFPNSFSEEIQELCSAVVDLYNSKRKDINNKQFIFAAKTMVIFGYLEVSNLPLKDLLDSNATIAKPYINNTSHNKKEKSGSGMSTWSIIAVIFVVIRIIFLFARNSSSNNYNTYDYNRDQKEIFEKINRKQNEKIREIIENAKKTGNSEDEIIEETIITDNETEETNNDIYKKFPNYSNTLKSKNHIRFIYTLKYKTDYKTKVSENKPDLIKPFTNPYPKTFNPIPYSNESYGHYTLVKNKSNEDLIVFRLTTGIDQSLYIPKNEKTYLNITNGDSLVFYTGNDYVVAPFSHFKNNPDLSKMHEIKLLSNTSKNEISVYPFTNKIINTISNSGKKINDTLRIEYLKMKKISTKTLDINAMYTTFYNENYKNKD